MAKTGTPLGILAAILVSCVAAPSALAQDAGLGEGPALREARHAFEAGREAFAAGRYDAALEYFERAYALTEHPDVLYDIAHTAERIRNDERALSAFEGYLAGNPESPERAAIEARIATLRRAIAERNTRAEAEARAAEAEARAAEAEAAAAGPAQPEPAPPAPSRGDGAGVAGWIVLGVGIAAAGVGAGLLGGAEARAAEVRDAPEGTPWPELRQAYADADGFAVAGGVLLGVGLAAATAGLVIALTVGGEGDAEVAIGPAGLTVRGRL